MSMMLIWGDWRAEMHGLQIVDRPWSAASEV